MAAPDSQSQGTNEKRLRGKVAAITGAGAGNGRATVLRLGHDGASVFISDIDQERVDETLKALREVGIEADGGIFDASKAEDAGRFIDAVIARYGQLDILVNNAGAIRAQPFPEVTEETWDWVMDLNLKGAYFYMQEAAKQMTEQRSGTIINIASVAGIAGGMTLSPPYAGAKAALINLTKVAAAKMAEYGVTVNAVAPGIVNTAFNWNLDEEIGVGQLGMKQGEHLEVRCKPIPIGRIGEPEDVANAVAFLAGPDAAYITAETLIVSGGLVTH